MRDSVRRKALRQASVYHLELGLEYTLIVPRGTDGVLSLAEEVCGCPLADLAES